MPLPLPMLQAVVPIFIFPLAVLGDKTELRAFEQNPSAAWVVSKQPPPRLVASACFEIFPSRPRAAFLCAFATPAVGAPGPPSTSLRGATTEAAGKLAAGGLCVCVYVHSLVALVGPDHLAPSGCWSLDGGGW